MSEESKKKVFFSMIIIIIAIAIFIVIFVLIKASSPQITNTTNITKNEFEVKEMQLKNSTAVSFSMPISYVGKNDKGVTITGTIDRGSIKIDDEIQIVGMGKEIIDAKVIEIAKNINNSNQSKSNITSNNTTTNISSNETKNDISNTSSNTNTDNTLKQAVKGNEIVLTIIAKNNGEIAKENIVRGQIACEPYTYNQYNTFTAEIIIDKNNALKITDISKLDGEDLQIYIRNIDMTGKTKVVKAYSLDSGIISVKMESYVAIEKGTQISIRKNNKTIASGTIESVSNT